MGSRRDGRWWTLALMTALLVVAPVLLWRGLVTLPHRYDDLRDHGVPVRLRVTECGVGVGGDSRGYGCRVRLGYGDYTASWKEGDLRPVMSPDGTVGGVVDPRDPDIHATSYELATRAGAGFRGPEVFAGGLAALLAVVIAVLQLAAQRQE